MRMETPAGIESGDTIDEQQPAETTETLYARRDGALVPIGERVVSERLATDGGTVKNLTGEHLLDLRCNNCNEEYQIDETVGNDCPVCGHLDFEVTNSDPEDDR